MEYRISVICFVRHSLIYSLRSGASEIWSLVKGSPEAIESLLLDEPAVKPAWYRSTYRKLVSEGMRVLALAYKPLDKELQCVNKDIAKLPRDMAESNLRFAGFVAFTCLGKLTM